MTACAQPGCSGYIDQGGFCNVCGCAPPGRPWWPVSDTLLGGTVVRRSVLVGPGRAHIDEAAVLPTVSARDPLELTRPPRPSQESSSEPTLREDELVGDQYRITGTLARGGLGWVYLAKDERVGDLVAVKGLIDPHTDRARELVDAERKALVELDHPNIVRIRNFVRHPDPRSGELIDYIVMEYVVGQSLQEIEGEARRGGHPLGGPLRAEHVASYGLEILDALDYLHGRGLLYCDMKPANVIHSGDQIKLIDLGGVRRIEDRSSPVVGTPGFQVPIQEITEQGLTVRSDLYALGKTLQALLDVAENGSAEETESLRQVIARAAHSDPEARFGSAAEMAEQLGGALREILSLYDGRERPEPSAFFATSPMPLDGGLGTAPPLRWWTAGSAPRLDELAKNTPPSAPAIATGLPALRVDPADPAAGFLETVGADDLGMLLSKLAQFDRDSAAIELLSCRARLHLGDLQAAERHLAKAEELVEPGGRMAWTVPWHRGLLELARRDVAAAHACFTRVYAALPGEGAPKLALALCAEHLGRLDQAERLYRAVWLPDRSQVGAAFGLARLRLAAGRRGAAVQILDEVPESSRHYDAARLAAIRVLLGHLPAPPDGKAPPTVDDFRKVLDRLPGLYLDDQSRDRLVAAVREAALAHASELEGMDGGAVLGAQVTERGLRLLLERSLRTIARQARDRREHDALIDRANAIRPWTVD